jgi:hypothetical protein
MSDEHVDALANLIISDAVTFASLPLPLARLIFMALPADARGRACCVCRAWRDVLAEPSLCSCLDMSVVRVERPRFVDVLRGAARRSRGQLLQLDLSQHHVTADELLPVLNANAGSLRELHLNYCAINKYNPAFWTPTVEAIVAAAPLLQVLAVEEVVCSWEDAPRMLRAEPSFAPLQMRRVPWPIRRPTQKNTLKILRSHSAAALLQPRKSETLNPEMRYTAPNTDFIIKPPGLN